MQSLSGTLAVLNDREKSNQVVGNSGNRKDTANSDCYKGGDASRNHRQHGGEAVRYNKRRKAGRHHRGRREEKEHDGSQRTYTGDRCTEVKVCRSAVCSHISRNAQNRKSPRDKCSSGNAGKSTEGNFETVSAIHPDVCACRSPA